MTKKTAASKLSKQIEQCKAKITAERDKLRLLIDDAESVADSCADAVDSLNYAVDRLSEYL